MESKRFLKVLKNLPQDYEPYGTRERSGGDCSSGCAYFHPVVDPSTKEASMDWGVCANELSHRSGLLTFEHQGCDKFSSKEILERSEL